MPFDMPTPQEYFEARAREYHERHVRLAESDAPADDTPAEPAATTPHVYGPPAAAPRESNYISDDNLLLWLAEKQDGLYADLRDEMDLSRARNKIIEDLSYIKARTEDGELTPEELYAEMTALFDAYRGTPLEPVLQETLGEELAELGDALQANSTFDFRSILEAWDLPERIQSKIDSLGKDDQLALIRINALSSDINQAAQLASNLLSSSNQTANGIIGNIGR
ncbi:MAG TPA: hypothetical protein VFZ53_20830 [Polyangiaceae bacterium]